MSALRRWAWWLLVAGAVAALAAFDPRETHGPPWSNPGNWIHWCSQTGPGYALFAFGRQLLMACGLYLLALGLMAALARWRGWGGAFRAVTVLCPRTLRSLVLGSVGVAGVASLAVAAVAGDAGASIAPPPPVLRSLPPTPSTARPASSPPSTHIPNASSNSNPPATHPAASPVTLPAPPPSAGTSPTFSGTEPQLPATWTVRPGDSLWRIAEQTLGEASGREASDADVARYCSWIVELNRSSLPNPANPNLIFPGDLIRLPALPNPGGN
jgi:hypothetical protein